MNQALIDNWNKTVKPGDTIYHLGDISFGRNLKELNNLNGNKIFILGNHDQHFIENMRKEGKRYDVRHYAEISYLKEKLVLFHFPIDSWNRSRHGSIHCHGHCHGTFNKYNVDRRRFDVGVDVENLAPVSIEEIIDRAKLLPVKDLREYESNGDM